MVLSGSNGITFPDSTDQGTGYANGIGFRNRIINGDMRIDQRNAGAAVTVAGSYPVDRFLMQFSTDGAFSAQRSTTAPAGFTNSLVVTTTTADGTLAASQQMVLQHHIEGFNVADLGFGTASAKSVTISFWVRSSLTGTFGGSLKNSAANRSYPFTYTISVADTWEQKSVTVAGDTSGTWLTDNGIGLTVSFGLGVGTDRSGTAGAWNSNNNNSATGAVSVIGTLNATWYITGVQLEVGSVATPFERRPYGTELALCQRYYCKTFDIGVAPGNNVAGAGELLATNINQATYEPGAIWRFPVAMRAVPTITMFNPAAGTAGQWYDGANSTANARAFNPGNSGVWFDNSGSAVGGSRYRIQAVASIEL